MAELRRMREPQQSRSQNSTTRMLSTAMDILHAEGLAGLTISAVSQRAGVSVGSLYHRFGGRHGLLLAIQERWLTQVEEEWRSTCGDRLARVGDEAALAAVIDMFLDGMYRDRHLIKAFLVNEYDDAAIRARGEEHGQTLAGILAGFLVGRWDCELGTANTVFTVLFAQGLHYALYTTASCASAAHRARLVRAVAALLGAE